MDSRPVCTNSLAPRLVTGRPLQAWLLFANTRLFVFDFEASLRAATTEVKATAMNA